MPLLQTLGSLSIRGYSSVISGPFTPRPFSVYDAITSRFTGGGTSGDMSPDSNYIFISNNSGSGATSGFAVYVKSGSTYTLQYDNTSTFGPNFGCFNSDGSYLALLDGSSVYNQNFQIKIYNRSGTTWTEQYNQLFGNGVINNNVQINYAGDLIVFARLQTTNIAQLVVRKRVGSSWTDVGAGSFNTTIPYPNLIENNRYRLSMNSDGTYIAFGTYLFKKTIVGGLPVWNKVREFSSRVMAISGDGNYITCSNGDIYYGVDVWSLQANFGSTIQINASLGYDGQYLARPSNVYKRTGTSWNFFGQAIGPTNLAYFISRIDDTNTYFFSPTTFVADRKRYVFIRNY